MKIGNYSSAVLFVT